MSGACRETYNLRINPRVLWRWRTWKYSKRLLFEDNLMWLACAVLGHRAYNTSTIYEKPEHACSRCHRWLRHLDPDEWQPSPEIAAQMAAWQNVSLASKNPIAPSPEERAPR